MPIEAVINREIIEKINTMLAFQRMDPIHIRIVTPTVKNVDLNGESLFSKLQKLFTYKDVQITLIIKPEWMIEKEDQEFLEKLKSIGVKVHSNPNLHAKILLVENNQEKLALVGSANYTIGGLKRNDESSVYFINDENGVYEKLYDYITNMLKRINEYIIGSDTTSTKDQLEKRLIRLEQKRKTIKESIAALENGL